MSRCAELSLFRSAPFLREGRREGQDVPEDTDSRLLDSQGLRPGEVQGPYALVLGDGEGLEGGVEGAPCLGCLVRERGKEEGGREGGRS